MMKLDIQKKDNNYGLIFIQKESDSMDDHDNLVIRLVGRVIASLDAKVIEKASEFEIAMVGDRVVYIIGCTYLIVVNDAMAGTTLVSEEENLLKKIKTIVESY